MRLLVVVLAAAFALVSADPAIAAVLDLRLTDRLDLGAPSVSQLPVGSSAVVAAVGFRDLPPSSHIDFVLRDADGRTVATYREPVSGGGSGTALARLISPGPLAPGVYVVRAEAPTAPPVEATFTIGAGGAPTPVPPGGATGVGAPVVVSTPRAAATPPVQLGAPPQAELGHRQVGPTGLAGTGARFGLANVLPDGQAVPGAPRSGTIAWMTHARAGGAGGNRWEFRWDAIESSPGQLDWREPDRIVAENERVGLPLLAILIGTPEWARTAAGANAPPVGLDQPPILPDGTVPAANPWARFVHEFATRYRGRVAAYEIWNEPNRPDFWSGGPAEYYRLLATAMATIRHADPSAQVVFGGLDGFRDTGFLDGVLDAAFADPAPPGRRGAFDVLAWHAYHRPLDVYVGTQQLRDRLRARGLRQPIWITETNVAAWDDRPVRGDGARPYRWSATGEEQSAYVLEALAYAVVADVERIYLYRASDTGEREAWGLLQIDGTPRQAERAFRFATALLSGATKASRLSDGQVERILIERPGEAITIAWATGPTEQPLLVESRTGREARLHDKIGGLGSVAPIDGRYILSLPGASANQGAYPGDYIIGGDPYVIVESLP